jgi:UDP-N-acetyl-2-amino-2-deoxyglucuronate dehydrogenase
MAKELKLSIVGCGSIAAYVAAIARLTGGVQLAAACDISPERVETFAQKHHIPKTFTRYEELLAEISSNNAKGYSAAEIFSAVYLSVPHNLHFEMLKMAIDAGIDVFAEKPITRTYAEGREIVAYAREKGVKIGVNYQYRYDSGCYRLARVVQSGALGSVFYVRINVPWHREQNYFNDSPWHKTFAQAGGGTLITQASHLVDIALWAIGSSPVSAMGYTTRAKFKDIEVEDLALGTVELKNGTLIQITSSMVATPEQAVTIEVYGEDGTAKYIDKPTPRVKYIGVKPKIERVPKRGGHALHRSLKGFRDWVLRGEDYLVPGEEALPVLQVVEAIYQSAQSGQRVQI